MSLIGTLWRRAPAWRLSVVASLSFTGLWAMFPPTPPNWRAARPPGLAMPGAGAAGHATEAGASFTPMTGPSQSVPAGIMRPPSGADREGVIPLGGRKLALPAGKWQELAFGRTADAVPRQMILLARVQEHRLTGLVVALAPDAVAGATGLVDKPEACSSDDVIAGETAPATPGQDPFAQECWTLTGADIAGTAQAESQNGMMRHAFDQLRQAGVAVPPHMLALRYIRSSESGWLLDEVFVPDRHAAGGGVDRRLLLWCKRFAALLHRGYDGTLTPGELARDPG